VHVWRISLCGSADRHVRSLSPVERARLERRTGAHRARFAISHGATREVLGAYLDCAPAEVPLESRADHPPRVGGLELSLAHCDRLALLAVALTPVGVDLEEAGRVAREEVRELAAATLTPAELRRLLMTPCDRRGAAWLRFWVRKEALLKAQGRGFGDRLPSEVDVSAERVHGLTLVDLDVGADHVAAAALTLPAADVTLHEWIDTAH